MSKRTLHKQLLSVSISALFVFQPVLAAELKIEIDRSRAGQNTTLDQARNGTKIVNISTPNKNGVSHNTYIKFNVPVKGTILNNSANQHIKTRTAGYINGNKNLRGGKSAKLILNEVSGTKRTHLRGKLEVAGKKADVIIANPNGITVNGGGFINIPKATLTTGKVTTRNGKASYDVDRGDVLIEGKGLNANETSSLEVYTKAMRINAKLHAKDLKIVTGSHTVDENGKVTSKGKSGTGVSLDSTAVGGIYANSISLVGTDRGVGINLPKEVLAQDKLKISADGKIVIESVSVKNHSDIESRGGSIEVKKRLGSNTLRLKAKKKIKNRGKIEIKGNSTIRSKKLDNANAHIVSSGKMEINTEEIDNREGNIESSDGLYVVSDSMILGHSRFFGDKKLSVISGIALIDKDTAFASNHDLFMNIRGDSVNKGKLLSNGVSEIRVANGFTNYGSIVSADSTIIHAKNIVNQVDADIQGAGDTKLNAENILQNYGFILSSNALSLDADKIENRGGISASKQLTLKTRELKNYMTLFSGTDMNLYVSHLLVNGEDAYIYSTGALNIASNDENGKTDKIENSIGVIESEGDMHIYATRLENIGRTTFGDFEVHYEDINGNVVDIDKLKEMQFSGTKGHKHLRNAYNEFQRNAKKTLEDNDLGFLYTDEFANSLRNKNGTYTFNNMVKAIVKSNSTTKSAKISAKNIYLNIDDVLNKDSIIQANDELVLDIANSFVNDVSDKLKNVNDYNYVLSWWRDYSKTWQKHRMKIKESELQTKERLYRGVGTSKVLFGSLSGNIGGKVLNGEPTWTDYSAENNTNNGPITTVPNKNDNDLNNIPLPSGRYGLFIENPDKNGPTFVLNPEYDNFNAYINSDYMLKSLGYDGAAQTRRLGDAMYETKLVRDSIISLTGQRFIGESKSDKEQYKKLMDSGVKFSKEVGLTLGKEPTEEQLKHIDEDLVWMVEKTVRGKKVLMPVVYLAKKYNNTQGAIISGNNIDLKTKGHFVNSGTVKTKDRLVLDAKSVINAGGKLDAAGTLDVTAKNDIRNISGTIKGAEVFLTSKEGDIVNETATKEKNGKTDYGKYGYTVKGKTATIESTKGNVVLDAGKDIVNRGADMKAKDSVALFAKNNITIKTIKDKESYDYADSNGYAKGESLNHVQSNIKSGGDFTAIAGKDVNLEAVNADAKRVILLAENGKVNSTAVVDSKYDESHYKESGLLSKKSSTDMRLAQNVKGTTIKSDVLIVDGKKGVTLESVNADIGKHAQITSKEGNVDFKAKSYTNATYHEEKKSALGGLIASKKIDSTKETLLADSSTKSKNSIVVNGKEVNVHATDLQTGKDGYVALTATDGKVNIVSGTEARESLHLKEKKGLSFGISGGLSGGTKVTFAEVKTDTTKTYDQTEKSSNIHTGTLYTKSSDDTNIIGSNIEAKGWKATSGKDINVLSVKEKHTIDEEHKKKEIGIELKMNKKEQSAFAGYWEDSKGNNNRVTHVKKSTINVGNLGVKAKNMNVVGSDVVYSNLEIDVDNLRVLDDATNSNSDAYVKQVKAGVEIGVKQNLSDAVDSVKNIKNGKGTSGKIANGLKAYDAVNSFASSPVSAGVNAIYNETKTNTNTKNSESVGSKFVMRDGAKGTVKGEIRNELEIRGSEFGSKEGTVDLKIGKVNVHAGESTYSNETKNRSKNGSVQLYGTKMGEATIGYQESKNSVKGTKYTNGQFYVGNKDSHIDVKGDVNLKGGNIKGDALVDIGGDLNIETLQNREEIRGRSRGGSISANLLTMTPTGASANYGRVKGDKAWTDEVSGLTGNGNLRVHVKGDTENIGGTIANVDKDGKDMGNLDFRTKKYTSKDVKDYDHYSNTNVNVGVGSKGDNVPTVNSVGYGNSKYKKEQIVRATVGAGNMQADEIVGENNRDLARTKEITRDDKSGVELYASRQTLALATDTKGSIARLQARLNDVGLASHKEITENIPDMIKKDEDGKPDGLVSTVLDSLSTLDLIPTKNNGGGYITQLATQLFGDNRAGIVVKDRKTIEDLGLTKERKKGDSATAWDYERVTLIKTDDGVRRIKSGEDTSGDNVITVYMTNPDKKVIIDDGSKRYGDSSLDGYKIYIDEDKIKNSSINHVFTNGMFNSHDTAVYNQQTQQGFADSFLNYNQQHGVFGDLMESGQDHLAANGLDLLVEIPTLSLATANIDGIGSLGTGGARQTGNLIEQLMGLKDGDLTVGAHSQGTLMTQVGMDIHREELGDIMQENQDAQFLVQYSGSPVNHFLGENLVADLYGDRAGNKDFDINNVFRLHNAPNDAVGAVLGYQSSGINNSEDILRNMGTSFVSIGRLFGVGEKSPHSYYPCVIGCGDDNYTPDMNFYDNSKTPGTHSARSVVDHYKDSFAIKDKNGKSSISVNLDLLPSDMKKEYKAAQALKDAIRDVD